jgi:hypothetical protein
MLTIGRRINGSLKMAIFYSALLLLFILFIPLFFINYDSIISMTCGGNCPGFCDSVAKCEPQAPTHWLLPGPLGPSSGFFPVQFSKVSERVHEMLGGQGRVKTSMSF